jgi:hypothetical protein
MVVYKQRRNLTLAILWECLSVSRDFGGMGFKSLQAFNLSLLRKQAWNLATKPYSLITILLKTKYFSKCDYFYVCIGHNPGYIWRKNTCSLILIIGK